MTEQKEPMEWQRDPGFLLIDVAHLYTRRFEERARGLSLTLAQCKTLAVLASSEGVNQRRLAEISEVTPGHLVRILDRMEAVGWAERRSHPRDRRAHSLAMTERAKVVVERIWEVINETHADALRGLTSAELETLMELLGRVHANLLAPKPLATKPEHSGADSAAAESSCAR